MASKIELYRELLEIEPNSKVFFPLARQLAEDGRMDEAVALLTRGIGQHPDYLEAKFLLLDILTRQGRDREAQAVFTEVGELLARYPSIWLLWSRTAAAKDRDPSLAMIAFTGCRLAAAGLFHDLTLDAVPRGRKVPWDYRGRPCSSPASVDRRPDAQ